jgi:co-chaperonin GroES (HSP10)
MTRPAYAPVQVSNLRPVKDAVIVADMEFDGRTTSTGIILPSDNGKSAGVRPRWAKVYRVGPEQQDVNVDQYILVAHGRWTRGLEIEDDQGVKTIRKIDPKDILMVSDEPQYDDTMSEAVLA